MKMNLKLQLNDIYGGDGFLRYEDRKVPKLTRTKSRTTKKEDTGIKTSQDLQEESFEIVKTDIHTFRRDGEKYLLRLGGTHGKFWGLMKEASHFMKEVGDEDFNSFAFCNRMMKQINISPINVELKNIDKIREDRLSQKLAGFGGTMIFRYYDVINQCEADITLEFPEMMGKRIRKILDQAQSMSAFNKRRGTFKILKGG